MYRLHRLALLLMGLLSCFVLTGFDPPPPEVLLPDLFEPIVGVGVSCPGGTHYATGVATSAGLVVPLDTVLGCSSTMRLKSAIRTMISPVVRIDKVDLVHGLALIESELATSRIAYTTDDELVYVNIGITPSPGAAPAWIVSHPRGQRLAYMRSAEDFDLRPDALGAPLLDSFGRLVGFVLESGPGGRFVAWEDVTFTDDVPQGVASEASYPGFSFRDLRLEEILALGVDAFDFGLLGKRRAELEAVIVEGDEIALYYAHDIDLERLHQAPWSWLLDLPDLDRYKRLRSRGVMRGTLHGDEITGTWRERSAFGGSEGTFEISMRRGLPEGHPGRLTGTWTDSVNNQFQLGFR